MSLGFPLRTEFFIVHPIPDPPKPEKLQEVKKTSTSALLQWVKPLNTGFDVQYYYVEVHSLQVYKLTNATSFALTGLKPYTKTEVLTSGCTSNDVLSCGFPGVFEIATSVDSKFLKAATESSDIFIK